MTYTWTDNAMQSGTACNVDKANDNLMYLKYQKPILNYLSGFELSNNGSDANNDIDIAIGFCADSTNTTMINLASGLTKRLDAAWAAGTNQGGLDTGSKATSTWYHVYAIAKADATTDILFSTSASAPTMPTDYVYKRRVGSIKTDGSGNIIAFKQFGDNFFWLTRPVERSLAAAADTSAHLLAISTPLGVNTMAMVMGITNTASGQFVNIQSPYETDITPDANNTITQGSTYNAYMLNILTDTSSQIRHRSSSTGNNFSIISRGWIDYRGKN